MDEETYETEEADVSTDDIADDLPDDPTAEDAPASFEVRGRTYVLRMTTARLDLYEERHRPIMASFVQNEGAFSVAELKAILAYSLMEEGGPYVNPRYGAKMAERLVVTNGYAEVLGAVMEMLQRDCGFLFKGATA